MTTIPTDTDAAIRAAAARDEPQRRALKRILLAALTAVYETDEGAGSVARRVVREIEAMK
jgi:hypothetical protein